MWRVGIDTGGTFTDVVAFRPDNGEWREKKVWSERGDPGQSLRQALLALEIPFEHLESVVYGTTIVTNALIEGAVAKVALISTKGFGDVLEIARQRRDAVFDLRSPHRTPPIVPREACFELNERCDVLGHIVKEVDEDEANGLFERIGDKCEAAAISFLHSYLNSTNEEEVARIARKTYKHVSVSHEVSPEAREYERTLVTALNASLLPMMGEFISSLDKADIPEKRLHLFHSAGGMVSAETASRFPLLLAMSGPAAGVEAASAVCSALNLPYAVTFDMGGTTTDCSLVVNGRADLQMDGNIGHYRVRQPMVAVESIGSGGGSIVRLTDSGLQIGPDSAGANPGPACYGRGGTLPTITDVVAILGYFGSGRGSERPISIDGDRARQALAGIAESLNLPSEEVALGAIRVANAVAARAIKRITMGRGIDARSCSLIAFGGAGPMLACMLAGELGIRSVVVPFRSSALSALGCLAAEQSFTRQRTTNVKEGAFDSHAIEKVLSDLESVVLNEVAGASKGHERIEHIALMRYSGQSYEIEIPVTRPATEQSLTNSFHKKHQETYGFSMEEPWECVAFRTTATGESRASDRSQTTSSESGSSMVGSARAYFHEFGWCEVREFRRDAIGVSERIAGPAIIVDEFSTILVPHNWIAKVENGAHIRIENDAS